MNKELHRAAARGEVDAVLAILDAGGNIHEIGPHRWPLLVTAAAHGHVALVERLLERGADRDVRDSRDGKTALHWAAMFGYPDVVELLLRHGSPVDLQDTYALFTPLLLAAAAAKEDRALATVELLLSWGADIEARTKYGTTALMYAAIGNDTALLRYVISRGADINARNNNGKTALCAIAPLGGRARDTLPVLFACGADPNIPDYEGRTALMWAATYAKREIVALLLEGNADLSARDETGWTALMHTAGPVPEGTAITMLSQRSKLIEENAQFLEKSWQERTEMVRFLLAHGADPTVADHEGLTALDIANLQQGGGAVVDALRVVQV